MKSHIVSRNSWSTISPINAEFLAFSPSETMTKVVLMPGSARILLVSHNFPPTSGPESSLVRLNTAWMLRAGFDVRVLTTTRSHTLQAMDRTLMAGLPEDLVVERQASPEAVLSEVYPRAGRHIAVLLGRHVLPEIFLPWALPATEAGCRMVRQWQPHVIYSRAPKHVSNVVGWRMKHQTGLPWVAHFSDPWITAGLPYRRLQRLLGLPLERRILRDADALVFVTRQAMERMLAPHPAAWRERARIIPHGYEAAPADAGAPPAKGPLTVIHAGAFYPGIRGPETLIEALKRMHAAASLDGRLVVECVGDDSVRYREQADAAGLAGVLHFVPPVPFDECQRKIAASHLTLILDTAGYGGVFLPTKLFEAFASRRPVLGLAEPGSAVAEILEQASLPWADVRTPAHIAEVFTRLLETWETRGEAPTAGNRDVVERFEINRVNEPLAALLHEMAGR